MSDYGKAYADSNLYTVPMKKVEQNERVREVLGEIEPMGKLAILNGAIHYSEDNKAVEPQLRYLEQMVKLCLIFQQNGLMIHGTIKKSM